jgi:short-subunit dehydrogenase
VKIITVLSGFVQTKMTENLNLPGMLTAAPEEVAEDIYAAYKKGKDVIYSRWFWKWIAFVIGSVPEPLFKRLRL